MNWLLEWARKSDAQLVGSLTNATHNIWTECAKAYQKSITPLWNLG
jgi:hypothetical protein